MSIDMWMEVASFFVGGDLFIFSRIGKQAEAGVRADGGVWMGPISGPHDQGVRVGGERREGGC